MRTNVRYPESLTDPDYQDTRSIRVAAAGYIAAVEERIRKLRIRAAVLRREWVDLDPEPARTERRYETD